MSRSRVPEVHLERLPHRHAVIRQRQAYGKLGQLEAAREAALLPTGSDKAKETVQEVTKE
jgi:hypothetical protein